MGKCKEIGEVAVMEVAKAGARTRIAREAAADAAADEAGRKRKAVVCTEELDYSTSLVQMRSRRRIVVELENYNENAASSTNDPCASCCSSNGSTDQLEKKTSKFLDLEEEQEESVETSTLAYEHKGCREGRESTPSSEVQAESDELESSTKPPSDVNSSRRSIKEKMPSKAELEDFFSAAEKDIQKQYAEKYNFDFSKEEPFEGRYEWARIKP